MRRFALFAAALLIVVVVGSLPWNGRASKRSLDSMCVCLPSRAALLFKSITGPRAPATNVAAITRGPAKR